MWIESDIWLNSPSCKRIKKRVQSIVATKAAFSIRVVREKTRGRMTLRQYLIIMILATILCWISWVFVLFNVDPFRDTGIGIIFFYLTLFFSLLGTVSLKAFLLSYQFSKADIPMYRHVHRTFVTGLVFSIAFIGFLFLQGKGILNLLNTIIFFCIILFFVLFRLSVAFVKSKQEA